MRLDPSNLQVESLGWPHFCMAFGCRLPGTLQTEHLVSQMLTYPLNFFTYEVVIPGGPDDGATHLALFHLKTIQYGAA